MLDCIMQVREDQIDGPSSVPDADLGMRQSTFFVFVFFKKIMSDLDIWVYIDVSVFKIFID